MRLDEYMHYSVKQEKLKKLEKNAQGIGSSKRPFGENKSKLTEQEKIDLQNRLKIEQYIRNLAGGSAKPETFAKQGIQFKPGVGNAGYFELLEKKMKAQQLQEQLK
mmetsp:Transcript_5854/g.9998  ORF Transcript_5854/g.9998 Transcript_5854/m.9998 type:complete len:106 (+) Transcript_5854:1683-2000(+)